MKKVVFRESAGRKLFYHLPTRISRMRIRLFFFVLKKQIQTKNFPPENLFEFLFFPFKQ